jgi:hypothetical protein
VRAVENAGMTGVQTHQGSAQVAGALVAFFESVGGLCSGYGLPFTVPPSPGVVYTSLLSTSAAVVSRGAGLLVRFKREFENLKSVDLAAGAASLSFDNGLEQIPLFNEYVMDFSNVLWRHLALIQPQLNLD